MVITVASQTVLCLWWDYETARYFLIISGTGPQGQFVVCAWTNLDAEAFFPSKLFYCKITFKRSPSIQSFYSNLRNYED